MTKQEKLEKIGQECILELNSINIFPEQICSWSVNTRAKRRWGQCQYKRGRCHININERLLEDDVSEESLKRVIIHELLHAVKECFKETHGSNWKRYANRVYNRLGYKISTTDTYESLGLTPPNEVETEPKYVFVCDGCGAKIKRFKESVFTRHPENYHCAKCGGNFKRMF